MSDSSLLVRSAPRPSKGCVVGVSLSQKNVRYWGAFQTHVTDLQLPLCLDEQRTFLLERMGDLASGKVADLVSPLHPANGRDVYSPAVSRTELVSDVVKEPSRSYVNTANVGANYRSTSPLDT